MLQVAFFVVTFSAVPFAFLFGILPHSACPFGRLGPGRRGSIAARRFARRSPGLGDPSLEIVYPLDSGWVDEARPRRGRIVARPGTALAPVESEGKVVAALVHDASLSEDPALLDGVAHAASLALHTQGLQAEARRAVRVPHTLVETAPSLFIHVGTDGRVRKPERGGGRGGRAGRRGAHPRAPFLGRVHRSGGARGRDRAVPRARTDFETGEYENAFVNARGERRVVFWRSAPVRNEAGKVTGIISGGIDITERRRRELDSSENATPRDRARIDPEHRRRGRPRRPDPGSGHRQPSRGSEPRLSASARLARRAARGYPFLDLIVDDSDGRAAGALATAAAGSASEEVESELRCADGSLRAFAWSAVPVADVTGRTEALVLVSGVEVTERRRLEAEKERERRAFLNAIANNAPSLLCLIDREGRLTHMGANMAFEQTLGYASEEIDGQVFWEQFVHPDDAPLVERLIGRAAAGHVVGENDSRWVTSGGTQLVVAWTCTPLRVSTSGRSS